MTEARRTTALRLAALILADAIRAPFEALWREWRLLYYRWALREIAPLHRDVPHIVRRIREIEESK